MKLHLPKGLRSAVLACMAVVTGFATTVGTGAVVGGALTIAFAVPEAQAAYSWKNGNGEEKLAEEWSKAENWELGVDGEGNPIPFAGTGPGTAGSNLWDEIVVENVSIGSATDRVTDLEGWQTKYTLDNATLYAEINKFQGSPMFINVNNESTLNLTHKDGHFEAITFNIGAKSSFTLNLTRGENNTTGTKGNGQVTINLNAPDAKMVFAAEEAYTLTGSVKVVTTLADITGGTMGTQTLGLSTSNVTLSNTSFDFGADWVRSTVAITEENYKAYAGMYYVNAGEDGSYTVVYSKVDPNNVCEWNGGALSWSEGTTFSNSNKFADWGAVTILADTEATLTGDVLASSLKLADGVVVDIAGEHALTATRVDVLSGATLSLSNTGNSLGSISLGAGSALELSPGKEATLAEVIGTEASFSGGTVVISGAGTNITNTGTHLAGSVVVVDGATLTFNESFQNLLQKDVTVTNGGKIKVTVDGSSAVNDLCAWTSRQNINVLNGGELDMGTTRISVGGSDRIVLDKGTITGAGSLESGGHSGVSLHVYGSELLTASNGSAVNANIRILDGISFTVNTLADSGNTPSLTIAGSAGENSFLKLENGASLVKKGEGTLVISTACTGDRGTINVAAGVLKLDDTTVAPVVKLNGGSLAAIGASTMASLTGSGDVTVDATGALTATNASGLFAKKGSGALTIGTMAGSNLSMNYEGEFSITTLNLDENAVLSYGAVDSAKVFRIDSLSTKVVIDVMSVQSQLATGIDLGLASSIAEENISVIGLNAGEYTLANDNGYWKLTSTTKLHSDWDLNWGAALGGAPTSVTEASITEAASDGKGLAETGYLVDDMVAVQLNDNGTPGVGSADDPMAVVGGAYHGKTTEGGVIDIEKGVWIKAVAGQYGMIVGGNMAGNWSNGVASVINTDSHIIIDAEEGKTLSMRNVIGGNYGNRTSGDGDPTQFNGDTYVSVMTDSVKMAVVGGSMTVHGGPSTLNGDTHVYVYTPLSTVLDRYRNEIEAVVGGMMEADQNAARLTLNGNTSVLIDVSGTTATGTFNKYIVGGNVARGGVSTLNGSSSVTINGVNKNGTAIEFGKVVVGGSFMSIGASSTTGDVDMNITGGTFNSAVVGGSYHTLRGSSTTGNVTIDISGGTFNGLVLGGSHLEEDAGTMTVGTVAVNVSGDSTELLGDLVGGFNIKRTGTAKVTANVGDITLSFTGGTVTNVYGGTHSLRNADSTVNQGDIVIDLQGGEVTGDVYAGGWQEGSTKLATESTLVKIGSNVTLTGTTISAGYKTDQTNSTIAGDKAILFTGDDQDRTGVTLAGFNKIGVETAGKTATIGAVTATDAVTITGAGIIKLGSDTNTYKGGLTVAQKATLAMNGKSITGTLTIEDGATVNGVASATDIAVGTYTNSQGMQATGVITVGTELSSSADITAGKITGAGDVKITGGTVTLSDESDAFANTGDTEISGAKLAGEWNADGVTIGEGTTVSGTIGLANSTINSTIENTGSIALSGSITVGVEGVIGESLYTHKDNKAADGNGYRSGTKDYALADTGCTASNVTWRDAKGNEITSAEFNNGKLTVSEDAVKSAYWVNTGIVSYDGSAATWNSTTETLDTDAVVKLNGGTLQLTGNIEAAASIAVETTGTIVVNEPYTLNQSAISGTGAVISGDGTYKLGDADALSVGLVEWNGTEGWTGTVHKSVIDKGADLADISSYANANSMIEVDRVLCGSLAVTTGSLTINESLTIQTIMKAGARSGATDPLKDCLAVEGKLAGGDEGKFDLVISEALLNTVIGVGASSGEVVLGTVGSKADNLAITLNGSEKFDLGDSSYTLGWQAADGKQQLVLKAAIKGSEWIGKGGTALWISEKTCDALGIDAVWAENAWEGSKEPSADKENANFLGQGDSEVTIFGKVTPGHLRVDTDGSYTITGGPITDSDGKPGPEPELAAIGRLNLLNGTLNIEIGKASFAGGGEKGELVTSVVADGAELNIGNSLQKSDVSIRGGLEIAGDATIANLSQLTVTEGDVTVTGTLTVEGDRTVNNGTPDYSKRGTLVADSLTNAGGKVTVNGGVVQIGSAVATADADPEPLFTNSGTYEVKGGGLTTVLGDAENSGTLTLTDGTINITGNLDSTDGTLTLTKGDMTVGGELSGVDLVTIGSDVKLSVGQYEDSTGLAIEGALTVTGESAIGSAITLGETGSLAVDGGSLTTGELKFGELTAESDAKVALSNGGSIGAPAITTFTTGAADGVLITLDNAADGLVDGDSFRLVDGEDDATGYRLADEYEQTVLLNALKAELLTDAEGMYLGVREQTADELVWNTSKDDSEGGLHIMNDSDAPYHGYQTLDTILTVNVDADRTIDLSSIAPDDADDSLLINELTGSETLTITGNGDDRVTINGGEMTGGLDIAGVDLQATDLTVGTLTGTTSAATTTIGGDITVTKSANYIGGYDAATITVTDGAVASLVTGTGLTVGGDNGSITLNYDSDATIDAIETTGADVNLTGAPDNKLTLVENSTMKGGSLNFDVKSDALGAEIIGGTLGLTGTAVNVAQADDSLVIAGVGSDTTVIASLGDTTGGDVTLTGAGFEKYFTNARMVNGNVVADRRSDYVKDSIDATSTNGNAGATLLDDSLVNVNPQVNRDKYATQAALLDAVDAGRMTDEDAAAVAGASVATLGMALSGDVERQLRAIRNRTTSMGVNECVVNEGMPYFNAWVNAEGNRGQLDKDGTLAGYSLDSWGGTVGFDVDFNPHFTAGLAITAMYGNLTADGPETKAEGDMDTYYVTLFARYAEAAWTHTFVGTIGKMDGTFDRTVNAGGVAYETEGSTDGMAFGLMYEVGYVMPLNEDATACMQPIFNVSLRHSNVGSYTEEGSDAALEVGSQSMTVLTFGLGARMQAVVGESLYNRASIFEARALAKVDVGDRSSEADVAFIDGANGATVESAELGAFGVELGAGLTIPVGDDDGSIFIDGSVELRSGYTNVNGTVGYRINF